MTALVCPVVRQSHAWCRPHPRIRYDERWIGELMRYSHLTKGTISTTLCRYMATFVRLLASKPPIQEMRLDKPPLLRRQRTDPSKPSSQSGVLRVHGGHDAACIHVRRFLAVFGRFSREMLTKRPKTAILAFHLYNTPMPQYHHAKKQPNEFGWARYGQPARTPRVERVAIWSKILIL